MAESGSVSTVVQSKLFEHIIHGELVLLLRICLKFQFEAGAAPRLRQLLLHKLKMRQMLRLWRSRIVTYLDHISGHAHFDDAFREHTK